jgi:hypothetical protein
METSIKDLDLAEKGAKPKSAIGGKSDHHKLTQISLK